MPDDDEDAFQYIQSERVVCGADFGKYIMYSSCAKIIIGHICVLYECIAVFVHIYTSICIYIYFIHA